MWGTKGPEGRRVLVTGGDYTGPLAAVRALRKARYRPWATVTSSRAYAARSRAADGVMVVPDVRVDRAGFVDALADACEHLEPDVLLAGTEADLVAVASAPERFGSLASSIPSRQTVLRVTSKQVLGEFAARAGLQMPPTIAMDGNEVGLATVPLPAVIKPVRSETESHSGFLHADVHIVKDRAGLLARGSELAGQDWLVQPLLRGQLGAVCGVAWHGDIVCAVHQRSERIWPEDVGVSAYARTVARDITIERGVAALVEEHGWSGLFQAQFIHSGSGSYLIDFNPRAYGSLSLAVAAGANLPAMWATLAAGGHVRRSGYEVGVRYRSEMRDLPALGRMMLSGHVAEAWGGLIPRRRTVHEVVSIRDPRPLLTTAGILLRRYWARWQGEAPGT